ncbi:thioredoxin-disulfide reductase [Ruminococcaceae bacterium OttesenSCG-928-N02]|nr:thioredoxin-disulfide reductase [Ruminococcaceae bacterium OttesenSCG-928-N02]
MKYDIAIIGAGPAGLSAAIYAQRAGYTTVCFEQNIHGGQIINTPEVENYPALGKISGVEYAMALYNQAVGFGAQVVYTPVQGAQLTGEVKKLQTPAGEVQAGAVIIANGVVRRKLECPGEDKFIGRGVSYCATCDGNFFTGKTVAVVGGGNTALEDAVYLAGLCEKVYLVHRRDEFRAAPHEVAKALKNPKIQPVYSHVPTAIEGDNKVQRLVLESKKTGEETTLEVAAVFVAVGLIPQNEIFKGTLPLSETGYILAGEDCKTEIPGVFAAGDTRQKTLRQLITAAADGAIAATNAAAYLGEREG